MSHFILFRGGSGWLEDAQERGPSLMGGQSRGQGTWASPFLGAYKLASSKEKILVGIFLFLPKGPGIRSREVTGVTVTWCLVWGLVRQTELKGCKDHKDCGRGERTSGWTSGFLGWGKGQSLELTKRDIEVFLNLWVATLLGALPKTFGNTQIFTLQLQQ